jgi:acyl carrier protein
MLFHCPNSSRSTGSCLQSDKVRAVLAKHGRLSIPVEQLEDSSDLYKAGLTSLATVGLMLALEEQFDVEFPDNMLGRKTFGSIEAILEAVARLAGK